MILFNCNVGWKYSKVLLDSYLEAPADAEKNWALMGRFVIKNFSKMIMPILVLFR